MNVLMPKYYEKARWCIQRIHSFSEYQSLFTIAHFKKRVGGVEMTSSSPQQGLALPCSSLPGCSGLPGTCLLCPGPPPAWPRLVCVISLPGVLVSSAGPAWSLSSEASNPVCQDTRVSFFSRLAALNPMPRRLGNSLNFFHVHASFVERNISTL